MDAKYLMEVTAKCCGFEGTLAEVELHSCDIHFFGGRCEDYPCCGHTDGGGCQTTPEMTSEYYLRNPAETHLGCDHNTGYCNYEEYDDERDDM
jgi:hypothetical protein